MYILCSHDMPSIFRDRIPFPNASTVDTPIYQSSIAIFETDVSADDPFLLNKNGIKFVGFIPYVNLFVSNESKNKELRGKTFSSGVYVGAVQNYRANSAWKHKAIYLFNGDMIYKKSVKLYTVNGVTFSKPGAPSLISSGIHRYLPCEFIHPLRKGSENRKSFSLCLIHRGPNRIKPASNLSLGCVTVDPQFLDTMMKFFSMNEMLIYIHRIDQLISDSENVSLQHIDGIDFSTVSALNNMITANVNAIAKSD